MLYLDETSFNVAIQPLKCWQYIDRPAKIQIATRRPSNMTLFGAICSSIPNAMFMLAESTNQHDLVRFLKQIRISIAHEDVLRDHVTYIILDNHSAHKTRSVVQFINEDFASTGHRFELAF